MIDQKKLDKMFIAEEGTVGEVDNMYATLTPEEKEAYSAEKHALFEMNHTVEIWAADLNVHISALSFPLRLICKQTKGGIYNSHPTAYFDTDEAEEIVCSFYQNRGHNEGYTNWLALKSLEARGGKVVEIKMVGG
jgi:uncharacterized Zn-finger protein